LNKPVISLKPKPQQQAAPAPSPAPAPKPPQDAAPPSRPPPKPLDVAEQFFCDAKRDKAQVEIAFLDGTTLAGHPAWVGQYSLRLRLSGDGAEAVAFKAAMKWIKRIPGEPPPPESEPV
jgi:sRNA-binding regulator protein Hfq